MRSLVVGALLVGTSLGPTVAWAQAPAADVETLVVDLDGQLEELQSAACETACAALESLRRSAEAICELDPGERCAVTRDKVAAAAERVRARCDCADAPDDEAPAATEPVPRPKRAAEGMGEAFDEEKAGGDEALQAPGAVEPTGGCAACAVAGRRPSSPTGWAGWWGLAVMALAVARRRTRRR